LVITQAPLWVVAGIGLACGIGYYTGAFVTTVLVLSALFFLSKVEKQILRRTWYHDLEIEFLDNDSKHTEKIKKVISKFPTEVKDINIRNTADNHAIFVFSLKLLSDRYKEDLQKALSELPQVVRVSWVEEE
jgi:putative Mg2+ transporter-C (MgtC) family protein